MGEVRWGMGEARRGNNCIRYIVLVKIWQGLSKEEESQWVIIIILPKKTKSDHPSQKGFVQSLTHVTPREPTTAF